MLTRHVIAFGVVAMGLLLPPAASHAQATALPSEAQSAVDQGLAKARSEDFKGAADEFLAAWKLAPDAPQIWFDLGLADSKLPGYELRAIAWFELYLLKAPDAPDVPAVRSQIAALEAQFEARINAATDGFEDILKLIKASPEAFSAKDALVAPKFERWTAWQLASIRFALGDAAAGWRTLKRDDGDHWRQEWDVDQRNPGSLGGFDLAEAMASAGLLDQAFGMLQHVDTGDADEFFLERGALEQARRLPGYSSNEPVVHVCSPDELAHDAAMFHASSGDGYKCLDYRWWSTGRQAALLAIAVNGVHLDGEHDDTDMLGAVQPSGSTIANRLFDVWHMSSGLADLTIQYRKVRGPTGPVQASATRQ